MPEPSKQKTIQTIIAARSFLRNHQTDKWLEQLYKSHSSFPFDDDIALLIADEMNSQGMPDKAIDFVQMHLRSAPATAPILGMMAMLAMQLEIYETAEKLLAQLTAIEPGNFSHYLNIYECMRKRGQQEESLNFLMQVIPAFPGNGVLWGALAVGMDHYYAAGTGLKPGIIDGVMSMLAEKPMTDTKMPPRQLVDDLHKKATDLAPGDFKALSNYANFLGEDPKAETYYKKAIEIEPDDAQIHVNYGIHLLSQGKLKEAWPHYEYRKKVKGKKNAFALSMPFKEWQGEFDKTASLLICGEQGLGDELLFYMNIPTLIPRFRKIYIGCDPRLVKILQESFPECEVAAYEDTISYNQRFRTIPKFEKHRIEYQSLSGSIPNFLWPDTSSLPDVTGGFIKSQPALSATESIRLAAKKFDRVIGISWRSSNLNEGRQAGYWGLQAVKNFISVTDALFVNLQYDSIPEELSDLANFDNFINIDSVDLRDDLQANIAIMNACDVVVGPAIATQMLSFAIGKETWIISAGAPWYTFNERNPEEWQPARHLKFIIAAPDQSWAELQPVIREKILGLQTPKPQTNDQMYAFFRTGIIGDDLFLNAVQQKFFGEQFVILSEPDRKLAEETGTTFWTDLPKNKQSKARFLKGGEISKSLLTNIDFDGTINAMTILVTPAVSAVSLFEFFTNNGTAKQSNLMAFIEAEKASISYAYRFLNDYLGYPEEEAAKIFEPRHQQDLTKMIIAELEQFYFVGFQEKYTESVRAFLKIINQPAFVNHIKEASVELNLSDQERSLLEQVFVVDHLVYDHFADTRPNFTKQR